VAKNFTVAEARAMIDQVRPMLDDVIALRADLAELRADLAVERPSRHGGLAEAKAFEAQVYALLEKIAKKGIEVKGWAPLLLDLPGQRKGVRVHWCWLEGEAELDWYHRQDCGFAGRRRI
jgi:hypothetical protein